MILLLSLLSQVVLASGGSPLSGAGGGVVGPGSSITGQLAAFNGTDGNHIQALPIVYTTGSLNFYSGLFKIDNGSDRVRLSGNVIEITNAANSRSGLYINIDNSHPQLTTQAMDIWMEPGTSSAYAGGIACYRGQNCDLGYSVYQQGEIPGFTQFRHVALSNTLWFIPPSEAATVTIASSTVPNAVFSGTIAGNNSRLTWNNWEGITYSSPGGRYWEMYMGLSSLFFTQTNLDLELNYEAGHGKLIIADQNAAANGKRLETITLVGGTKTQSNDSVTAKTVPFCMASSPGGTQGHLSFTVSAGVSYTINSDNVADTSTLKCLLIENGR